MLVNKIPYAAASYGPFDANGRQGNCTPLHPPVHSALELVEGNHEFYILLFVGFKRFCFGCLFVLTGLDFTALRFLGERTAIFLRGFTFVTGFTARGCSNAVNPSCFTPRLAMLQITGQ